MGADGPLAAGSRLGRYLVGDVLGQGGMGVVHRARDEQLGRDVAIKVLARNLGTSPRFVERFHREAEAAARVSHPNLTRCHEAGETTGILYLVLELVTGGTLLAKVADGPLPWREAAYLGSRIARALEAIHAAGIIHRDVKPANVLLDEEGRPKLTDFGVARGGESAGLTKSGELLGTLEYMAPEMAGGGATVDARADLYSLGGTIYHLLTGHPPFEGSGPSLLVQHLTETPKAPSQEVPTIPRALDAIVLRLLAKEPAARGSAREAAATLEELMTRAATTRRISRPIFIAGVCLVVISAGMFATLAAFSPGGAVDPPAPTRPETPVPAATPGPPTSPGNRPSWFTALARAPRLPPGVEPATEPGEYVNKIDASVLVHVPEGTFLMGAEDGHPDERPVHPVALSGYFLGKYEVSVAQFRAFFQRNGAGYKPAANGGLYVPDDDGDGTQIFPFATWDKPDGAHPALPTDPVTQVRWEDAMAYVTWAHLDLPTEAQWERAAAWDGSKHRSYAWGDAPRETVPAIANLRGKAWLRWGPVPPLVVFNFEDTGGEPRVASVTAFAGDRSPVGALNMTGNVREWTKDAYVERYYETFAKGEVPRDPLSLGAGRLDDPLAIHTIRGGSWKDGPVRARSSHRRLPSEIGVSDVTGFRVVVREPPG